MTHGVSRQGLQTVVGLSHVTGLPAQVHTDLAFGKEHQPRTRLSTTPPPSSRRTSNRDPRELSVPKSMKGVIDLAPLAESPLVLLSSPERSSADRHRRNRPTLIPSRRQNSVTVNPLAPWRENSSRHIAVLRLTRLLLLIAHSSSPITGGLLSGSMRRRKERRVVNAYGRTTRMTSTMLHSVMPSRDSGSS